MLDCQITFAKKGRYETDIYGRNPRYIHRCKEKRISLIIPPTTEQSKLARLGAIHRTCKQHCNKCK